MKVCYVCGALYLTVHIDAPISCQACSLTRATTGRWTYMGVYLRPLTEVERKALYHWLMAYVQDDGR